MKMATPALQTLFDFVRQHAKARPEQIAFQNCDGSKISWKEAKKEIDDLIFLLKNANVSSGHSVLLSAQNNKETVLRLIALFEIGASVAMCATNLDDYQQKLRPHFVWEEGLKNQNSPLPLFGHGDYFFQTSGTTGAREIVWMPSVGLLNTWSEQVKAFHVNEHSKCAWMLSPDFDASLSDIGVAVLAGATLFCVPFSRWTKPSTWKKDMERFGVTHIDAPPSWLSLCAKNSPPKSLRVVVVGGEVCPPGLVQSWSPDIRFVNVYGPTECTICTSLEELTAKSKLGTIGFPLKNVDYKILQDDNPVTPKNGDTGELVVFSKGLAHGYLGNTEKTNERFGIFDGRRYFKTRDEVLCLDDGNLVFLGRLNRSFKKNGKFINLDSIEQLALLCPGVDQAAALSREKNIEVFFSGKSSPEDIRAWLRKSNITVQKVTKKSSLPVINSKINRSLL